MKIESGLLTAHQVRENFRDVIDYVAVEGQHVVMTRSGKRLVAIIPYEDFMRYISEFEDLALGREMAAKFAEALANNEPWAVRSKLLQERENEAQAAAETAITQVEATIPT